MLALRSALAALRAGSAPVCSALEAARARMRLRGVDRLGARARVDGPVRVMNHGRLLVGDDFALGSTPIESHLLVFPGATLEIGDGVRIGHGASIAVRERVTIGAGSRVGPLVMVMDTNFHAVGDWKDAKPRVTPVVIGRGVTVGGSVVILPGSEIGDGAEVEAGALVSGRVPAGARVAGVPARVRRAPGAGSVEERVARVLIDTFGLPAAPDPATPAREVPGWNLVGSLKLLLAVEEEFGTALVDAEWRTVERVADVTALVARAARAANAG